MTIIRGPQPRENFQILPNATARDKRLSFRARGLLVLMLSYPENWQFNRDWLARQTDGEGVSAVRTALTELENAGYLTRRRIRVNGRFDWEHTVYRSPQNVTPDQSSGGKPSSGIPADGNPPSKEELRTEDGHEDAMSCLTDSVGAGDSENTFDPTWRDEDRELFRALLGDKVRSDGTKWREGVFTADAFYRAFQKERKHRWPGRRLQKIHDDMGFENWLWDEGLEQI